MNAWLWSAAVLLLGLLMCGIVCWRASVWDCLIAFEMAGVVSVFILLLVAEGSHRPELYSIALTTAVLSFPGTLIFIRFMEPHDRT
ncbi:MAG TPA: monovalent cation/H+ antiporter complex subunit F [Nitrospiraceae bacterium]|nr:monovalent cation/H+ antiporter complex subunit F [Nitrospiraceae bacterium]